MKILTWILKTLGPRRIALCFMAVYAFWLVVAYRYHFVDNVNLLIHEAGHLVFSPFGETLGMLGGTVLQLFFPLAFVGYFWKRTQRFEAAVCGLWSAESFMYTAEYMADANALALPLVGGHIHDWRWFFERRGVLESAEEIGLALHVIASLAAIVIVWAAARAETASAAVETAQSESTE